MARAEKHISRYGLKKAHSDDVIPLSGLIEAVHSLPVPVLCHGTCSTPAYELLDSGEIDEICRVLTLNIDRVIRQNKHSPLLSVL